MSTPAPILPPQSRDELLSAIVAGMRVVRGLMMRVAIMLPASARQRLQLAASRMANEEQIIAREFRILLPVTVEGGEEGDEEDAGPGIPVDWEMPRRTCPECEGFEIEQLKTKTLPGGRVIREFRCRQCGRGFEREKKILSESQRQKLANGRMGTDE